MTIEEKKTHHPVAFKIPISVWDKVEKKLLKEKQGRPDRKLTVQDYLVELIDTGLSGH